MRTCFFCLLAVLLAAGGQVVGGDRVTLDPKLPYQARKSNPVTYDVDFSAVVTPPYHTKVLKVWLPLPQSDEAQSVTEKNLSSFPMKVKPRVEKEKRFGNTFAYFEFHHPEGAQIVRHQFQIKTWELRWNVDPAKVAAVKKWPAAFDPFLKGDRTVVVDERFLKVARELVPQSQGESKDLAAVMAWINRTMKYDHAVASLQASSEHALSNRAGHCSDYHGLCAALGRALGYPTRVTYGINPFPKNSPSHCRVEAFLPPYGWVSFDVSETHNMIRAIKKDTRLSDKEKEELSKLAQRRLEKGFRDNTWFLQTRGTDYDLAPPAAKRVAVVRTIYAEADGVALPEPDPANPQKREFSWMTIHQYKADRKVTNPFRDYKSLQGDN
jgi:transglutaminase-like putative cysteine protease